MRCARHPFTRVLIGCGSALFVNSVARGASVTANYSANHVNLICHSQSNFIGATKTDFGFIASETETSAPPAIPHPPFIDSVLDGSSGIPLGGGLPKDGISGLPGLVFANGTASTSDTASFSFSASGSASAGAKNSIGELASGQQLMDASASFFVDANFGPLPVPVGTVVGAFQLPAIRTAGTGETITGRVFRDGTAVLNLAAGSGPSNLELIAGHSYTVRFDYEFDVPHGVDPNASFNYTATIVPEPGALALFPLLGGWFFRSSRRRRPA